jgi:PEP-CTERM motif
LGGSAAASANARNSNGAALTSASAPVAVSASALTNASVATVGPASPTLVNITAGQAVSNATLTPNGSVIGIGAMSVANGYGDQTLEYSASAIFDFTTSGSEALDLDLLSDNLADTSGTALDSLELQVTLNGTAQTYTFSSLTGSDGAEAFFAAHALPLGDTIAGVQSSVSLSYDLTFAGTQVGDGFGFTYDIADPPPGVPEPSTWAMMALGFAGLAFAGYRRSRMSGTLAA